MPRRKAPPRLYLDPRRGDWIIRDGASFIRTGLAEDQRAEAEQRLGEYLGAKHTPARSDDPSIADVLTVYGREHLPHTATVARTGKFAFKRLAEWCGDRRVSAIGAVTCREYARLGSDTTARRDLEMLRAAVRYYAAVMRVPLQVHIVLPPRREARSRWLTRQEAARLLWAARRHEHLRRFILLGLYTGSRSKNLLGLTWAQIDINAATMHRRPYGAREHAKKRSPPVRPRPAHSISPAALAQARRPTLAACRPLPRPADHARVREVLAAGREGCGPRRGDTACPAPH
jgi:integrase